MDSNDPFKTLPIVGLQNRTQVINVTEERIAGLEYCLGKFPGPYDPLNGNVYIRWERKVMTWFGRVTERLAVLQELGVLPPEQASRLKLRAMAAVTNMTAKIVSGTRS